MRPSFTRGHLFCALIAFLGCLTSSMTGQTLPLTLHLPDKSQAEVTEHVVRGGQDMKFTYRLTIEHEAGGGWKVEHANARIAEFQGRTLGEADQTPMLAMALTIAGKSSVLQINREGAFESVSNVKEIVSAFEKVFEKTSGPQADEARNQMLGVIRSENGQRMMSVAAATAWRNCVENWIGFNLKPGDADTSLVDSETIPGLSVRCERKLTNLGAITKNPLLWHLKLESRISDEAYGRKVVEHMRSVNPEAAARLDPDFVQKLRPVSILEGYIDPATLRPHWVKVQTKVEAGGESKTELFEYEFKWLP